MCGHIRTRYPGDIQCRLRVVKYNCKASFYVQNNIQSTLLICLCCPDYLFRIIISHSAHACDGELLLLSCPRHSTISVQSAFYRPHTPLTYCNAPTALQVRAFNHAHQHLQGWIYSVVLITKITASHGHLIYHGINLFISFKPCYCVWGANTQFRFVHISV